jgi:ribosomal protein S18 acetylase RimI-like enzyme
MVTLRPASSLAIDALVALWNGAYGGYSIPLTFDRALLERHVRRSGIDLARSVVGAADGEDFGVSLAAFRDSCAWIGGFGVRERFRRRGLATRLMRAHLERNEAADGVTEVRLEVIDSNPAREVYRRCGFNETRRLKMFEGAPEAGAAAEVLMVDAFLARHAALNPGQPAWRRAAPTQLDAILIEQATPLGVDGGYAVAGMQGEHLFVFDAAAETIEAGARLLAALGAHAPGVPIRLVDQPEGSPLARACEAAGLANPLNQFEMSCVFPA